MRPGQRRALDKANEIDAPVDKIETLKAACVPKWSTRSDDQAPVRPCEGALPRADEEHRATGHAVRAEQL